VNNGVKPVLKLSKLIAFCCIALSFDSAQAQTINHDSSYKSSAAPDESFCTIKTPEQIVSNINQIPYDAEAWSTIKTSRPQMLADLLGSKKLLNVSEKKMDSDFTQHDDRSHTDIIKRTDYDTFVRYGVIDWQRCSYPPRTFLDVVFVKNRVARYRVVRKPDGTLPGFEATAWVE